MRIETHPFNDIFGLPSINCNTTKLILGTFPAYQVTNDQSPRLKFYYGSIDNKFWDLLHDIFNIEKGLTVENILDFLTKNNYGIIDIIRKCYRKGNTSSADEDLSIIEFQDLIEILRNSNIDTIYTTSKLVTKLLKQQIEPLLNKRSETQKGKKKKKNEIFIPIKSGDFEFEQVALPSTIFNTARKLNIKTLYSPSDQGIRGITKGLNNRKIKIDAIKYRMEQYRELLK